MGRRFADGRRLSRCSSTARINNKAASSPNGIFGAALSMFVNATQGEGGLGLGCLTKLLLCNGMVTSCWREGKDWLTACYHYGHGLEGFMIGFTDSNEGSPREGGWMIDLTVTTCNELPIVSSITTSACSHHPISTTLPHSNRSTSAHLLAISKLIPRPLRRSTIPSFLLTLAPTSPRRTRARRGGQRPRNAEGVARVAARAGPARPFGRRRGGGRRGGRGGGRGSFFCSPLCLVLVLVLVLVVGANGLNLS
ncbi:hypothetical protein EJ03DRAFT_150871 [Teratosphaeria nubilosa]|uniref:Uncharacterized protein n=1 Tax=Teratosphaeria nubilosa TaxID=161662 RepID=A0A6G1LKN5_9PEZI|nr:hypothetical protein EJ03DRAFT_150871 [Teratosphaeria nubilosa]